MPKLIMSLCGPSACGKATLMDRLMREDASDVRSLLRIPDGQLITVGEGDEFHAKPEVPTVGNSDIIVHKWQLNRDIYSDTLAVMPEIDWMKEQFPTTPHRIVFMWLPLMQWWHGMRSKNDSGRHQSLSDVLDWIYETLLPTLEGNSHNIPVEHLFWYYPVNGDKAVYSLLEQCPERPKFQPLD